jgi:hypothetical protein
MNRKLVQAQEEKKDYFAVAGHVLYKGPLHNRCGDGCALMGFNRRRGGIYHQSCVWGITWGQVHGRN